MSERKVPKLRFAGFTDDWKQRKLGEVLLVRNEFAEQHYFKIDIELENLEPETGRLIGDLSIRTKTNSIFKKGDILFGRLRPYLKKWHLAQTNGLKSGEIWAFYSTDEFCRNFIYLLVQTENFLKIANISAGTKMPRADWNLISQMSISVPTLPEQQAIGEFFKQLDDTIAFHQREWEKYKNLKISYLEKMFPQENENKPQLRFPNFTDAWKQRKLGEVTVQIKSYSLSRNVETNKDTGFKYVHYGDIHRNIAKLLLSENNLPSIQKGNYEFLQKGDLVIADASEDYEGIGNSCLVDCFLSRNIVAGLHTIALRPTEVNSLFLYYLLHTDIFSQYGKIIATGTKVFGITAKNLLNFEFYLPTETEQQAIGEFFKQLDDTIAFHQRELEKYKNLKNGYLKQMFV